MQTKLKRLLLISCLLWGLFPNEVLAQESTSQNDVNIQVDRLEGTTGAQSSPSTSGSGLFHADDTQQLSLYQQQQQKKREQQTNDLFRDLEVQTTHEVIQEEPLFTTDHQQPFSASSAKAEESFTAAWTLAPLTENQWFWIATAIVFVVAVWISYQLYKRDKHASY